MFAISLLLISFLACTEAFFRGVPTTRTYIIQHAKSLANIELDVGTFGETQFAVKEVLASDFGIFRLSTVIAKADMKTMLNEYKDEMKKRKVSFPGFRAGVGPFRSDIFWYYYTFRLTTLFSLTSSQLQQLPPNVMADVRKYIVCYGLETAIGALANINKLRLCGKEREDVKFGEDAYYREIITNDFDKIRDAWKEGMDFSFTAEFYATLDTVSDDKDEESVSGAKKNIDLNMVIDTEATVSDSVE